MFDSSWINNEIGVKGSLVTAEVRGLLDKQFTEGFSSFLLMDQDFDREFRLLLRTCSSLYIKYCEVHIIETNEIIRVNQNNFDNKFCYMGI